MSSTGKPKLPRRTTTKTDYGVFGPDKFWGHVLTGPTATVQPDSFEARVERAWRFMRTIFFTPEEHAALVEAMVQMITQNPDTAPTQGHLSATQQQQQTHP